MERHLPKQQETQLSPTNRATHLCKCNGVVELLKHAPPHMCYHAKFGRSALKGVGINTEEPPTHTNRGRRWNSALLGWEAWLTQILHAAPHMLSYRRLSDVASPQRLEAKWKQICHGGLRDGSPAVSSGRAR